MKPRRHEGTKPGDGGTKPGDGGTTPGDGGTTPGDGGTTPGDGGTTPGDGGTTPRHDGMTIGRWHRTLVLSMLTFAVSMLSAQPPPFTSIAKGNASDQQISKQATVRTAAEWKTLWAAHAPTAKMPSVDFTKDMVVGIFLGTKPTDGYDVEIVGVRAEEKDLVVEYVQKQPGRGTIAAQILTEPFHLVTVPKHAGTVRFLQVPGK